MGNAIGGMASGIDTGAIVDALVAASARTRDVMTSQQEAMSKRETAYGTLGARLTSLSSALAALDTPTELRSVTGSSKDESALGVTVGGTAVVGRFQIKVNTLASASMSVSTGVTTRDTGVLATGTLGITVGTTTTNVTVDSTTDSLDDLAEAINDQVAGVTAYVMETGDATSPYRLVVAGQDTGAANAVSLDTSGLDSMTGELPTFTEVTAASDAEIEVNGVLVTDDDNDIEGAILGVTFHANEVTTSTVEVNVARDDDSMVTKLNSVVTAWNAVMSHVRAQSTWNPDEDIKGAFIGESVPKNVLTSLQGKLSASFGSGTLTSLGALGIKTTQDGDLELDEDVLRGALDDDFDDVVGVMTGDTGAFKVLTAAIDGFVDEESGSITGRKDSLAEQITVMEERITAFNDRLEAYKKRLEKQFTAMEIAMSRFQSTQSALTALFSTNEDS
jgi:flagellar hook-associated protein 2